LSARTEDAQATASGPQGSTALGSAAPTPGAGQRRALLVGVTRYDNLKERWQLDGPANDVALLRKMLTERFQFPDKNIVALSEAAGGPDKRPTRGHIEREFRALAGAAQAGDQVVVLLAGHGSQQPEKNPPHPLYPKPDGLDGIVLPADVGSWAGATGAVANAISNDDLCEWVQAITAKRASVWLIVDTCHAGSMTRVSEITRDVPVAELGVPQEALDQARQRAAARGGKTGNDDATPAPLLLPAAGDHLVAICACRSDQTEPEGPYPEDGSAREYHGLLTFTLCEVLTQAATPLTYRELTQRIAATYAAQGRSYPMPLVKGKERDREVLGTARWPGRSAIRLNREGARFQLNQGSLSGLSSGSVLAVHPPAGQADGDRLLGHVRITQTGSTAAEVEPVAYADLPAVTDLPPEARCEVAAVVYGQQRLSVALDSGVDTTTRQPLLDVLASLAQGDNALVRIVAPDQARWLVRQRGAQLVLVPAVREVTADDPARAARPPQQFGTTAATDQERGAWLASRLRRIIQAQGLLAVAGASEAEKLRGTGAATDIQVDLIRYKDKNDRVGDVLKWSSGELIVRTGDRYAVRLHNPNPFAVDVTLLYVDSGYGITAIWPDPEKNEENRLPAGKTFTTPRGVVNQPGVAKDPTLGLEHLVVIAIRAQREPIDFTSLEQPTLVSAQRGTRGQRALGTPLGALLSQVLYRRGPPQAFGREEIEDHALRILTWEVKAAPGASGPK